MTKLIKIILFIFYRYYKSGNYQDTAFFSAVSSFLIIAYISILDLSAVTKINMDKIVPIHLGDAKIMQYLQAGLTLIPGYIIIYAFFKEDIIKDLKYSERTIEIGKILLIAYIILAFMILFIFAGL